MLAPTDLQGGNPDPSLRPHIINNSWSGGSSPFYLEMVRAWRAAGIFPVFAAGNRGPACSSVGSPGDYAESLGVGATDSVDGIASFSARGPSDDGLTKPDVVGPGSNVRSAGLGGTYRSASGTSMAAPHAAGMIALVWSATPSLIGDIPGTFALLRATAVGRAGDTCGSLPGDDPNNVYGDGRIDAFAAVSRVYSTPAFARGAGCAGDVRFDISDPIRLLGFLFSGATPPGCVKACDTDDSSSLTITDGILMLQNLFFGGAPPADPYPACGSDPTFDLLSCLEPSC